jgi:hypothetical protein
MTEINGSMNDKVKTIQNFDLIENEDSIIGAENSAFSPKFLKNGEASF